MDHAMIDVEETLNAEEQEIFAPVCLSLCWKSGVKVYKVFEVKWSKMT